MFYLFSSLVRLRSLYTHLLYFSPKVQIFLPHFLLFSLGCGRNMERALRVVYSLQWSHTNTVSMETRRLFATDDACLLTAWSSRLKIGFGYLKYWDAFLSTLILQCWEFAAVGCVSKYSSLCLYTLLLFFLSQQLMDYF